jgi:hypothetical protein
MIKDNKNTITFKVIADDKYALEKAINYVNFQSNSDYKLTKHVSHEVGIGTIEVSQENINPEFLFMMGVRYSILCKKLDIKFD